MKRERLETFQENGYAIYRVPCIVCTGRGTLIVTYECRHAGSDWSAMDMAMRRSTDGGNTWSPRRILISGQDIDVIHNGILFADGDIVHFLWHRNYREIYHMRSFDDGLTWTEPVNITYAVLPLRREYNWTVIAAGPGHGLVTSQGRMIVPLWVSANRENITSHHPSVVSTLYSDDHGDSWHCGEIIWDAPDFVDPNESTLAQLPDGQIMISTRHETGGDMRKVGFSADGVSGWHDFRFEPQMRDPVCAASLAQGQEKIWYSHCDCRREEGRIRLSIHESADGGKNWPRCVELAAQGGYSDIACSRDGACLYVIGEAGRGAEHTFSFHLDFFSVSVDEFS